MHAAHVTLRGFLLGFAVPALAAAALAGCGGAGSSSGTAGSSAPVPASSGPAASGSSGAGAVASGQAAACKAALVAAFKKAVPVPSATSAPVSVSAGLTNASACKGLSSQEMNKILMLAVAKDLPSSFPSP